MKAKLALLALPLLFVAACGKGGDGNTTAPAAPVAGATPPAGQQWSDMVKKTDAGGYLMGNPNAPIKLVEYGSRTCPHCAAFDQEGLPKLEQNYIDTGKVSYEFRDFPVHSALDMPGILLGRCVDPDQYFPMLNQMMANQQQLLAGLDKLDQAKMQGLSPSQATAYLAQQLGYVDFVRARGVPADKAQACLTDKSALDAITKQTQDAVQKYDVNSTPTFIVNGDKLPPADDEWSGLKQRLDAAGA
ncbi:MAG: thioredoxin domain-containing protein [Sphingomonas sp.]